MTSKSVLCVAADGCEEIELVAIIDILTRVGVGVTLAGLQGTTIKAAYGTTIQAEIIFSEADRTQYLSKYDGIVVPGGKKNALALSQNQMLMTLYKEFDQAKKLVAAICAAPSHVLVGAGIVQGRKMSGDPVFNDRLTAAGALLTGQRVTTDGNMVTGTGPGSAMAFGLALADYFGEKTKADEFRTKWGI